MATTFAHGRLAFYSTPEEARDDTLHLHAARFALVGACIVAMPVTVLLLFWLMAGDVLAPGQSFYEHPGKYVPLGR